MISITTHTIVKNEENWIWYSLLSVKDLVSEMLVFDDKSSDKTLEIIKTIKDKKIKVTTGDLRSPSDLTAKRNEMLNKTRTDWFLLLDGDEVWDRDCFGKLLDFLEDCDEKIYGVVVNIRNCIGDIYHYLPENAGNYQLLGRKGHLTIRAYRKLPGFSWVGNYPLEAYVDYNGVPISDQPKCLKYLDVYYWHMTHLSRTSVNSSRKHSQISKYETGLKVVVDFPEVFNRKTPILDFDPLKHRGLKYEVKAALITPLKELRRRFKK